MSNCMTYKHLAIIFIPTQLKVKIEEKFISHFSFFYELCAQAKLLCAREPLKIHIWFSNNQCPGIKLERALFLCTMKSGMRSLDFHKCHLARIESFGFFQSGAKKPAPLSPSHTREQFRSSRKCFAFFFRSRHKHTRFSIVHRNVNFVRVISKHSTSFEPDTRDETTFFVQFSLSTRPLCACRKGGGRETIFCQKKNVYAAV